MTIDAATLPSIGAGATLQEGETFTVRGTNFDLWPDEIVLGYTVDAVRTFNEPIRLLVLAQKTQNTLVFRVQQTFTYEQAHRWIYFGSPSTAPRYILEYTEE